jgi:hypothetical protein
MSRLIYVPQYPANMRYQEWWLSEFTKEFEKEYDEVEILGLNWLVQNMDYVSSEYDTAMFSPINKAARFETSQMDDYMALDIRDDDTLFLSDISFPGLFCNVLYHKTCPKMYAFCHATSLNKYDYFAPMRKHKKKIELNHAQLFDGIFFGSYYSINKTKWSEKGIKCHRVTLPAPPEDLIKPVHVSDYRDIDIVSVCRPSIQKVNKKLEKKVEQALGIKIHREEVNTWEQYNILLARSKVLLISTKEDTFNYTIMDAIRCGCIPLVPNTLCFPEIVPLYWRYSHAGNLILKLQHIFNDKTFILPEMICQDEVDNFFKNIIKIMKR